MEFNGFFDKIYLFYSRLFTQDSLILSQQIIRNLFFSSSYYFISSVCFHFLFFSTVRMRFFIGFSWFNGQKIFFTPTQNTLNTYSFPHAVRQAPCIELPLKLWKLSFCFFLFFLMIFFLLNFFRHCIIFNAIFDFSQFSSLFFTSA